MRYLQVALVIMWWSTQAHAGRIADKYAAPDGLFTASGTIEDPWDLDRACASMEADQTVYLRGGTYSTRASIYTGGAAGREAIMRAYPGETPTIDAHTLTGVDDGALEVLGCSHVVVDGIAVTGCSEGYSIRVDDYSGVSSSYVTIQNCTVLNHTGKNPIMIDAETTRSEGVVVDGCTIKNCNTGIREALRVSRNVRHFKIINNTIENITQLGIDLVGWTANPETMPTNGYVAYNHVSGVASGAGIYVDGANDVLIEHNTITLSDYGIRVSAENAGDTSTAIITRRNAMYKNSRGGFTLGPSATTYGRAKDCATYNNTLYGNSTTAWAAEYADNYALGTSLWLNNAVRMDNKYQRYMVNSKNTFGFGNSLTADYNIYYPDTTVFNDARPGTSSSLTAWKIVVSPAEANSFALNPGFTDPESGDFTIPPTSPAVDAGGPIAYATTGGGWTIGVTHAAYFCDGFGGVAPADKIIINGKSAVVTARDRSANTLTLSHPLACAYGDSVYAYYNGAGPDIGLHETGHAARAAIKPRRGWRFWRH